MIICRVVILTFDAMAIDGALRLNKAKDEVDGFIDLGKDHGRRAIVASNVLAFMVRSVTTKWKQVSGSYLLRQQGQQAFSPTVFAE